MRPHVTSCWRLSMIHRLLFIAVVLASHWMPSLVLIVTLSCASRPVDNIGLLLSVRLYCSCSEFDNEKRKTVRVTWSISSVKDRVDSTRHPSVGAKSYAYSQTYRHTHTGPIFLSAPLELLVKYAPSWPWLDSASHPFLTPFSPRSLFFPS